MTMNNSTIISQLITDIIAGKKQSASSDIEADFVNDSIKRIINENKNLHYTKENKRV